MTRDARELASLTVVLVAGGAVCLGLGQSLVGGLWLALGAVSAFLTWESWA